MLFSVWRTEALRLNCSELLKSLMKSAIFAKWLCLTNNSSRFVSQEPHKAAAGGPAGQSEPVLHCHMSGKFAMSAKCLPHLDITSGCQCDRWLHCASRWYTTILLYVFGSISFSDGYSGLTGVDFSVVFPLMEPICPWGRCSKLSQVLKYDGCRLFANSCILFIFAVWVRSTLAIWLWGNWWSFV